VMAAFLTSIPNAPCRRDRRCAPAPSRAPDRTRDDRSLPYALHVRNHCLFIPKKQPSGSHQNCAQFSVLSRAAAGVIDGDAVRSRNIHPPTRRHEAATTRFHMLSFETSTPTGYVRRKDADGCLTAGIDNRRPRGRTTRHRETMPRDAPVTSATFPLSLLLPSLLIAR